MYIPKYFSAHEFVPPSVYKDRGELSLQLIDDRILRVADWLRNRYGSTTINNWYWNGNRQWSGLRTPESPYYRPYSQHTYGRAIDCVFKNISAGEVREDIKKSYILLELNLHSITIEDDVSWLHVDTRNNKEGINFFKP